MVVRLDTQLVLDRLCEVPPEHLVGVLKDRLGGPHRDGQRSEDHELVADVGDAVAREEGVLAVHDDIDRRADEHGRREVEELVEDRTSHGRAYTPAVLVRVLKETREGVIHDGPRRKSRSRRTGRADAQ